MSIYERNIEPGRIDIDQLSIRLGQGAQAFEAVQRLSFAVEPGEFVCILGPSGCGKSTLLGALAGHLQPSAGTLKVDGQSVDGPSPERGMVFQHHTLLPWRSVLDNVAFGLKMRGIGKAERRAQAAEMLRLVGLQDFAARWPNQLSGGMQQRAEIARVLVNRPRLLLMDEPFGALDAQTRARMQELLLDVWTRIRTTVVFVTHDIDEALFLADRVLVMSPRPGRFIEDLRVDFRRPRQALLLTSPAFVHLKRHCLELLRHEEGRELPRLTPLGLPSADHPPLRIAL
ncbi:Taurine import ATP-binding protein TauB [compost metagenome]